MPPLDPQCLFQTLHEQGVDYVLVGGLAAVLHGSSTLTNDADIVPLRDSANLARLSEALRQLDARLRVIDTPEGIPFDPHPSLLGSMATLNLTTSCGDLDLVFSPTALDDFDALVAGSVLFSLYGYQVRVAALSDIIRSKTAANRPKDRAVLPVLHALAEEIARRDS